MFTFLRAFILRHREGAAVLASSAFFLVGALPLLWAIG
jgi:Na+-transporting NADH:ubiquinone oxidoreductase subunit NqrD